MPVVSGGVNDSDTALALASTSAAPVGSEITELGRSMPSASASLATTV